MTRIHSKIIKKNKKPNNIFIVNNRDIFDAIKDKTSCNNNGCTVIVPHTCDNKNLFRSRFASEIAARFPIVKENFHMLGASSKLGISQYVSVFRNAKYNYEIIFCNMIVENMNSDTSRNINYGALVYSMVDIKHYIHKYKQLNDNIRVEIHCPKIGSGSAGGNWHFVEALIEDIWNGTDVFAYFPNKKDSYENH